MRLINTSSSATDYEWTFTGAVPAMSTEENPTITLNNPGTYTLRLKADNGKQTQTVSKEITVFPDTNLRTYNDVRLGINVAHSSNNIGAFFSTTTRQVYKQEDMPLEDEGPIDIVFFGQNPDFIFNKFVSPDMANEYTFNSINNAAHTKFINLQESCECNASLSEMEFDAMQDDSLLQELEIEETEGGIQDFDNTIVPRIVLFETADGRKGAIKIKEFVQDGASSHIVADIKVQKQ